MSLPGVCSVCRGPVVWHPQKSSGPLLSRRAYWREPKSNRRHVCPQDRPTCGAPMRFDERCARRPGHTTEHRTAYAMANARTARTGVGL